MELTWLNTLATRMSTNKLLIFKASFVFDDGTLKAEDLILNKERRYHPNQNTGGSEHHEK